MTLAEIISFFTKYHRLIEKADQNRLGLVQGSLGLSICYYYLFSLTNSSFFANAFATSIKSALHVDETYNASLSSGLASLLFTAKVTKQLPFLDSCNEKILTSTISSKMTDMVLIQNLELFTGAAGLFLSLTLDNTNNLPENKSFLQCIKNSTKQQKKRTKYIGTPHGITGLLLSVLRVQNISVSKDIVMLLVEQLLDSSITDSNNSIHFPHIDSRNIPCERKYLSWVCWSYGDLMSAYAILKSSFVLNDGKLYDIGFNLLSSTINRSEYNCERIDLCCGISAMPIVYQAAHQLTGAAIFSAAYELWIQRLEQQFTNLVSGASCVKTSIYNPSLFYGITGATLTLLDREGISIDWKSALLI